MSTVQTRVKASDLMRDCQQGSLNARMQNEVQIRVAYASNIKTLLHLVATANSVLKNDPFWIKALNTANLEIDV